MFIIGSGVGSCDVFVGWVFCSFIIFSLYVLLSGGIGLSHLKFGRGVECLVPGYHPVLTGVHCTCAYGVCSSHWYGLYLWSWSLLFQLT